MKRTLIKRALWVLLPILPLAALAAQNAPLPDRERGQVSAEPFWRQALGGAVIGLPTVQAQSAVVALDGGNIKAYSAGGTPLWSYSARGRITPFVTRSREGTSYISRTNGMLIAVNRAGRELWRRSPGGPLSGPVISGWDGRLFVPTGKKISCYTASGNLLWSRNFDERIALSPRLDQGGGIMLGLENGDILRLNPFGGVLSWHLPSLPLALVSLSPGAGSAAPRVLVIHQNGGMEILGNPAEWYLPVERDPQPFSLPRLPSPPLAAAGRGSRAAVALRDGRTVLFAEDEHKILWTGDSHIRASGRTDDEAVVLYDERGIFVLSRSGATRFAEDGRRLWFIVLENAVAIPAFGDDGVLYAGSRDWILSAYQLEDLPEASKQSVYGPKPEGSYGTGSPPASPWADYPFRFEDREVKARLDRIGAAIQGGTVGESERAWSAYLMELASGEYGPADTGSARPAAPLPQRVRALELLSRVGSRETIPFLAALFKKESEPVIRAAAAAAIGSIGVDPGALAIQAFFDALSPAGSGDEQVLLAVAAATGALCRFSGPPLSDTGVKILTILSGSGHSGPVQRQAQRELNAMRPPAEGGR
jgi:outer membrane protein assembly factor BamB